MSNGQMPVLSRFETLDLTPGYQYSIYSEEKNDNFLLKCYALKISSNIFVKMNV